MKNKINILIIVLSICVMACNNTNAKHTNKQLEVQELETKKTSAVIKSNLDSPAQFAEIWKKLPLKSTPTIEKTNFDNIKDIKAFGLEEIKLLQLSKLYPDINRAGANYKFLPAYKLNFSEEFYSIVLHVYKGEHELETILITYDSDHKLSQYYNQDGELTNNALVIAYDEIAEGQSRKHAKIENNSITIIDEFYGNSTQIDTTKYEINEDGYINEIKTKFTSNLRPDEVIELNKTYRDTITFNAYNHDGDYALLLGKKGGEDIAITYYWDWHPNDKDNFKYGEKLVIQWKMDSIWIAGEGEILDFKEKAMIANRITSNNAPVKFLWREDKFDRASNQTFNTIALNESFISSMSNHEKAALGFVGSFIGNECNWDGAANEDRSNLKCKILTALDLSYQCSDAHLGFLRRWFSKDGIALKKLDVCRKIQEMATVQSTFDEITIFTDRDKKTISVSYNAREINMRESKEWSWTQTDVFEYTAENITWMDAEQSKRVEKTINNNPDNPDSLDQQRQDSSAKASESFVVSCGSGCAMTYSEHKVVANGSATEVVFKVALYLNDVQDDEYFESYIFKCDASNKVDKIILKGDDDYNIEDQLPAVQESLKAYAEKLCKSSN